MRFLFLCLLLVVAQPAHGQDTDGTDIRRVMTNHARDAAAGWSPSGSRVVYLCEVPAGYGDDRIAICTARSDGSGARRVFSTARSTGDDRPNVAILVYPGVQIIDHAIPYEVFGQFSLNNVYTVAVDTDPIDTFMGMTIVPGYGFEDAPVPDVLVLPGGNAGDAQRDPRIRAWIERSVEDADHVLTICTGIFFLEDHPLLEGRSMTTWYDRQQELSESVPDAHVVSDRTVVEDGKLVSAAGLGVDGALLVLERLHGWAWAEVVRLNMEHERMPASAHVPRASLADMKLSDALYGAFPWRASQLRVYEGGADTWSMVWRIPADRAHEVTSDAVLAAMAGDESWSLASEERSGDAWTSRWSVEHEGGPWTGRVLLAPADSGGVELKMEVRRGG